MDLAKFLVCAKPRFLRSGNEVRLLGLIRENWATVDGLGAVPGRGKRRELLMVQRQPVARRSGARVSKECTGQERARGWGCELGSGLKSGLGHGALLGAGRGGWGLPPWGGRAAHGNGWRCRSRRRATGREARARGPPPPRGSPAPRPRGSCRGGPGGSGPLVEPAARAEGVRGSEGVKSSINASVQNIKNGMLGGRGKSTAEPSKRPTLEEIKAYCEEKKSSIDPQAFFDYYTKVGWVYGKNKLPIKDWKACVRTWERNNKDNSEDILHSSNGESL